MTEKYIIYTKAKSSRLPLPIVQGKTGLDQTFIHSLSQIKNVFVHLRKFIHRRHKINNASKSSNVINCRTVFLTFMVF